MCGIVGIFSHKPVAEELFDSLIHLQHRGQDAAGILTCTDRFNIKNGLGLVQEIFKRGDILSLQGTLGIAHTRYPTAGGNTLSDVQPIWVGSPRGIALAHNGNLLNYQELAAELTIDKHRFLNSSTDSEILLHLLAKGLEEHSETTGYDSAFFDSLCAIVGSIFKRAQGSYSIVSAILGKGLLIFRDPHGIRPLVLGERINANQTKEYICASETTMFYSLGFQPKGDLLNGEVMFINLDGKVFRKQLCQESFTPCIFEYVYFARPDSTLSDINVYSSRSRMGENLGKRWKEKFPDIIPDVVIPTPFTSNTAALVMAKELGVDYSEGLYKNPFIGRTFIMPEGKKRSQHVRYKLSPHRMEIENKNVLILDDSIVRGTTCREIVSMLREHGAKAVYFALASPPIVEPCFYGIDIPSHEELIAANRTEDEIQRFLGVDLLLYQTKEDLVEAVTRYGEHRIKKPCMACMDGCYVTGNLSPEQIVCLKKARDQSKQLQYSEVV